ncbi:MAG: hypothetical protein PHE24_06750 [Patescibacteria group bacterium]|nr:hypothetical protein [Patescibacteria group bacterium]
MCQHPLDVKNRRELNFNRTDINYQINHQVKPSSIVCGYYSGKIRVWPSPEKKSKKSKAS